MTTLFRTGALLRNFGGVRALGPVDFSADSGVIGPNGSGKTTFFNVVTGFIKPTSGKVFW
jgi:branched-chain amino acid transport system ATP-binding protein